MATKDIKNNHHSVREAARILNIPVKKLYHFVSPGRNYVKSVKDGGRIWIHKEELQRFKELRENVKKNYLTPDEFAELVDIHPGSAPRLCYKGEIKSVKFLGSLYIPRSEVDNYTKWDRSNKENPHEIKELL
jgi:hypothetical protein